MSLALYKLSIWFAIFVESLFFIVIGIPVCLWCLSKIDKYSRFSISKKKRIYYSIGLNMVMILLLGIYGHREPYREDWALNFTKQECQISLPAFEVQNISYPADWNQADDFGVEKKLKLSQSLSLAEINQLENLCLSDSRWKKIDSTTYMFERLPDLDELLIKVIIYCDSNLIYTGYHRF